MYMSAIDLALGYNRLTLRRQISTYPELMIPCPCVVCCHLQTVERTQIIRDPDNELSFTDTGNAVSNPDLDPLLFVNCTTNPTGKCAAYRDVSQALPGTRTRLRFRTGPDSGLFVWHW